MSRRAVATPKPAMGVVAVVCDVGNGRGTARGVLLHPTSTLINCWIECRLRWLALAAGVPTAGRTGRTIAPMPE